MAIVWSVKDLVDVIEQRRKNKFDVIICFSGPRGNSKSTGLCKVFFRLKDFKPWKHIVYSRKEVMHLLETQKMGTVMDDEAIRTGYKRNFQDSDQKLLIQMLNMYRDNFNVYGLAVPKFYSLDKGLRDLIKIHVHMIRRGVGVIHMSKSDTLYSDDPWDLKHNAKLEENWGKIKTKNPDFVPPYHKLTTFIGYLYFGPLPHAQRELYELIKETKRKKVYEEEMKKELGGEEDVDIYNKILAELRAGRMSKHYLLQTCSMNNLKYTSVVRAIQKRLLDSGSEEKVVELIKKCEDEEKKRLYEIYKKGRPKV